MDGVTMTITPHEYTKVTPSLIQTWARGPIRVPIRLPRGIVLWADVEKNIAISDWSDEYTLHIDKARRIAEELNERFG